MRVQSEDSPSREPITLKNTCVTMGLDYVLKIWILIWF